MILTLIHELCVTIFAGCALYINLVEHPARMTLPIEYAVTQWAPSYKRAATQQASLAAISILSGLICYFLQFGSQYLVSALLMLFVFLFTLVAIMPTNHRLLALKSMEEKRQKHVEQMMVNWNRLHAVRTVASLVAVIVLTIPKRE